MNFVLRRISKSVNFTREIGFFGPVEHNFGISNFGLHPSLLRRDNIRFDNLHCWCSITRRLMNNLRQFILKQSTDLVERFSNLLLELWNDYHVLCWNLEKKFTSFVGNELLCFIKNTPKIVEFLEENFQNTKTLSNLCKGLLLWAKISPFLVITEIEDVAMHEKSWKISLTM